MGGFRLANVADLSRGEFPLARGQMAGTAIVRAVSAQPECMAHVQRVRATLTREEGAKTASELARLYAQRGSYGHVVMRELLWAMGDTPEHAAERAGYVLWIGISRIDPNARRNKPGDKTVASYERGARLIARRGAGLCIADDCRTARSRAKVGLVNVIADRETYGRDAAEYDRRAYCEDHFDEVLNKADAKAIENTFAAAHEAMAGLGDLLWAAGYCMAREEGTDEALGLISFSRAA